MRVLPDVVASFAHGWSDYLRRAPEWSPLRFAEDAQQFARALLLRRPARFHRPSTVTAEWPIARLRDFSQRHDLPAREAVPGWGPPVPTLVVPPRSGHDSCVVDLSEDESLLGTALTAGLSNLHCVEWLNPAGSAADSGIEAHLRVLADAVDTLGGRVNLIGFSQGGALAAMHAARAPESVLTLTLAAAPIDCHRGRRPHSDLVRRLLGEKLGAHAFSVLPGVRLPTGHLQSTGLQAAELPWSLTRLARLWGGIDDDATIRAESAYQDWLQQPQDVPARFYRWSIEHLFMRNELARGVLTVGGDPVDLSAIKCPLFLIAGGADPIVPPEQLWAIAGLVSTPPRDIVKISADCGHLGLVTDAAVLRARWLPLLRDVLLVSSGRVGHAPG